MNNVIMNTLQPIMEVLIATIITIVGAKLTQYLHAKTGIVLDAALVAKTENAATQAVLAVEEKGAAKLANDLTKWTGEQKHAEAINMVLAAVPTVTPEQASNLVNAALAKVPGLGASGDLSVGPGAPAPVAVAVVAPVSPVAAKKPVV